LGARAHCNGEDAQSGAQGVMDAALQAAMRLPHRSDF